MVREGATSRGTNSEEGNAMLAWKVERRLPEKELNELIENIIRSNGGQMMRTWYCRNVRR